MLFSSYAFIFAFLPATFFVYFYLNSRRFILPAKGFLVFASLFFYSWWNVVYLLLILASILFNFYLARLGLRASQSAGAKKAWLSFGIAANLALLGFFKYADFFVANANALSGAQFDLPHIALPLAISFFTFQQIAFLVDSSKGGGRTKSLLDYALFVSFFPQLIAGPIVHHAQMMPQFAALKNKAKNYRNIALGLFIFSIGLFKKTAIADTFAIWANAGFDAPDGISTLEAWTASLAYTFQLYFDFSGYTDMAIGAALLFNVRLPINFNSPYKSLNIADFWRRWHITLGQFMRDYIYIPLGGNRRGNDRTYANLLVTFFLGGLWHGASWMFVLWGLAHGVGLIIHRAWKSTELEMPRVLAWFITFNFVNATWVLFRAKDLDTALLILKAMAGMASQTKALEITALIFTGAALASVLALKNTADLLAQKFTFSKVQLVLFASALTAGLLMLDLGKKNEFLYFNF